MSVNILGGKGRGFVVQIPKGNQIRPTSVMLKRKVFDSWQNLEGIHFVDICAGSGSVGIEAMSRGARSLIFIEKEFSVHKLLKNNIMRFIEKYGDTENQIYKLDFKSWLKAFEEKYQTYDSEKQRNTILFFDPPYEKIDFYENYRKTIFESDWFKGDTWIESDIHKGIPMDYFDDFSEKKVRVFQQGSRYLSLFSF